MVIAGAETALVEPPTLARSNPGAGRGTVAPDGVPGWTGGIAKGLTGVGAGRGADVGGATVEAATCADGAGAARLG